MSYSNRYTEYSKKYIKNWLLENNPSFDTSQNTIENIYNSIEEQLVGLEQPGIKIVISQFLGLHYSSEIFDMVEEYLLDDHSETVKQWRELGIYNSEVAVILLNIKAEENFDKVKQYIVSYITEA